MSWPAIYLELFLSTIGFGLFMYGKKQRRGPHLATGVLMMGFPYVVHGIGLMLTGAAVLAAGLWAALRFGL
jgi:hypothetical protein